MTEEEFIILSQLHNNAFVSLHKVNGKIVFVSPNCEQITGYTSNELMNHSPYDFFHPEDVAVIEQNAFSLLLNNQEEILTEFRFKKKNGDYSWLESKGKPVKNEEGDIIHLLSIAREITQLKDGTD